MAKKYAKNPEIGIDKSSLNGTNISVRVLTAIIKIAAVISSLSALISSTLIKMVRKSICDPAQ